MKDKLCLLFYFNCISCSTIRHSSFYCSIIRLVVMIATTLSISSIGRCSTHDESNLRLQCLNFTKNVLKGLRLQKKLKKKIKKKIKKKKKKKKILIYLYIDIKFVDGFSY